MTNPIGFNSASPLEHTSFVGDVQSLQGLKQGADTQTREGLERAAKEFESLYLKMMLDSMRAAEKVWSKDNPLASQEQDMFRDMLDGQLAKDLSRQGSLGLADMLVKQLSPFINEAAADAQPDSATQETPTPAASFDVSQMLRRVAASKTEPASALQTPLNINQADTNHVNAKHDEFQMPAVLSKPVAGSLQSPAIESFAGNPERFTQAMLPYAEKAAAQLGVDPKLLVAQAALETGWGQSLTRAGHGSNLFGIKASASWQGEVQTHPTTEVYNGQTMRQQASFRAYDSIEQSFDDYVRLIQARYSGAANAQSPQEYADSLASGGYATDPNYSQKVMSIYHGDRLQAAVSHSTSQQTALQTAGQAARLASKF